MGKMGLWLRKRVNIASDQFAKSFGQSGGTATALVVTATFVHLVSDAHSQIDILVRMIGKWLGFG